MKERGRRGRGEQAGRRAHDRLPPGVPGEAHAWAATGSDRSGCAASLRTPAFGCTWLRVPLPGPADARGQEETAAQLGMHVRVERKLLDRATVPRVRRSRRSAESGADCCSAGPLANRSRSARSGSAPAARRPGRLAKRAPKVRPVCPRVRVTSSFSLQLPRGVQMLPVGIAAQRSQPVDELLRREGVGRAAAVIARPGHDSRVEGVRVQHGAQARAAT